MTEQIRPEAESDPVAAGAQEAPVDNSPAAPPPVETDESIVALFSRLVDDAETFVRAEIRLYRANLFSRLTEARTAIVMILTAFLLAQSAIIALLVGLVVILRPILGAVGATATVVVSAITIAGLLAWLAIDKISRVTEINSKTQRDRLP